MLKNIKLEGYTTKIPQHNTKLCKKLQKHSHHNIYPAISSKTESLKTVHPKKNKKPCTTLSCCSKTVTFVLLWDTFKKKKYTMEVGGVNVLNILQKNERHTGLEWHEVEYFFFYWHFWMNCPFIKRPYKQQQKQQINTGKIRTQRTLNWGRYTLKSQTVRQAILIRGLKQPSLDLRTFSERLLPIG